MATIQNSIAISDGATAPLQRMAKAAEVTTGRFEAASAAANRIGESVSGTAERKVSGIASAAYSTVPAFEAASVAATGTANSVGLIGAASATARAGIIGLGMTIATVFGSIMAVIGLIITALQSVFGSIHLSDEFSQTTARLNLMNDGLQTTAQLQAMIFASAQRARSEYQGTAAFVAKIGMMAGKIFSSNAELIGVAETINKIFKISGTGAQEQASATLQLSQALASGVLRGEELNAVFEAAPMMIQKIADYLKVDIGQIRAMAAEGQLSAAIVKNAMIAAADGVNQTFETIPKTWSDIWTSFKNTALMGLQPLFGQISSLANSPGIQTFVNGIATGTAYAGVILAGLINNLVWLGGVISDVGSYVNSWLVAGFVILGDIANAVLPYIIGALFAYAIGWATVNAQMVVHNTIQKVVLLWDIAITNAKKAWTAVTVALAGAQALLNAVLTMNPIPILIFLVGAAIAAFMGWQIQTMGLRNAIASAFSSIAETAGEAINFMIRRVNDLIGILNKAASLINGVFGTNIGTVGMIAEVDSKGWGKSAGDFVKNFDIHNLGGMLGLPEMPNANTIPDVAGDIASAGKDTADNTKGIKDAMEITEESLQYMRDIAEQEVINRYTTAEVKIELAQTNTINNPDDFDGMVRHMEESLFEAMVSGAEKVHL
ncbi:hypothetical protein P22_1960 [Propionispora sp. 2/2-37]|uniref:tape measure protein n=1 Tax=Propionispora sp. 2/2-37 TaxID=1677858 RepID=UPI0006BB957F|nr:tape measure protein [Propionispora sp. 2/2-37]CUH95874.1 hypothetical protein P22_1960 [Propionispora sp. 2/2-37]